MATLYSGGGLSRHFGKSIFRIQGARVTATYLTFVESSKLMAPLDFFRGFFHMIVAGRKDYS